MIRIGDYDRLTTDTFRIERDIVATKTGNVDIKTYISRTSEADRENPPIRHEKRRKGKVGNDLRQLAPS